MLILDISCFTAACTSRNGVHFIVLKVKYFRFIQSFTVPWWHFHSLQTQPTHIKNSQHTLLATPSHRLTLMEGALGGAWGPSPSWIWEQQKTTWCVFNKCTMGQPIFFLENWDKLHGQHLAKLWPDTNFQPPQTSFDHTSKAPKVSRAVRISPTWGPLELRRHGQTMSEEAENWCPAMIWPNVGRGVCPSFPKKFGLA